MEDDAKLEKAFDHIRRNQREREAILTAAENNEWELAASIVEGVLTLLGYAVSAIINLVGAVADWFSNL